MPIGDRFIHSLVIERPFHLTTNGVEQLDDYGQPIREWRELESVKGLIQPKGAREVALISQAGIALSDHTVYLFPTDLTNADRIRFDPDDGDRYEVTGKRDAAGIGHHLEVDVHLIKAAVVVQGS